MREIIVEAKEIGWSIQFTGCVHQNVLFDFQRKLEQQREFHDRITAYSQEVEALGETLTVPTLPRKATDLLKLEAEVIQPFDSNTPSITSENRHG